MQGVYKQMVEAFRSLGVETVAGVGTTFDPEVHEAIMREERDDIPDGTVLKEFRRGFRLGSQLLRAAMVQVVPGSSPHRVVFLFSQLGLCAGILSVCFAPICSLMSWLFGFVALERVHNFWIVMCSLHAVFRAAQPCVAEACGFACVTGVLHRQGPGASCIERISGSRGGGSSH